MSKINEQINSPTLIIKDNFLFPDTELVVNVTNQQRLDLERFFKENNHNGDYLIPVFRAKNEKIKLYSENDIFEIGMLGRVLKIMPTHEYTQITVVSTNIKVKAKKVYFDPKYHTIYLSNSEIQSGIESKVLTDDEMREAQVLMQKIQKEIISLDETERFQEFDSLLMLTQLNKDSDLNNHVNLLSYLLKIRTDSKYELFLENDPLKKLSLIYAELNYEMDKIDEINKIHQKTFDNLKKDQKKHILKEYMKTVKSEIGDDDNQTDSLSQKIKDKMSKFPIEVKKIAEEELKKMEQLPQTSSDYHVIRNYLEWLLALPWKKTTKDNIDLVKAKQILDEEHYGLDKVKKKILEFLAISSLKGNFKGQILCLAGPPGVGKTSLAKSIAKAVGRNYVRMSLGGVHDESEIRGHRRTYVGALPGKIVQNLKKANSMNPLFLLDEIDKLGKSAHGDPSAALLEVLDPEQNTAFLDNFINAPIDLSGVLFITTANNLEDIPGPLRDRMEIVQLSSYTHNEKKYIATNHLIPKQLEEYVLNQHNLSFTPEAVDKLINDYTRESGVRDLQRKIGQVCRYLAQEVVENKLTSTIIDENKIKEIMGKETVSHEKKLSQGEVGIASGLAWTSVGGEMLFIESNYMKGSGRLILTGSLGDVMKESANIALSYIKANKEKLGIEFDFNHNDIHLHFPSGAIPKDGPSAGIAICSCLISLFKEKKFPNNVAMTGEISLRGNVLPVGGIKEKVLAAHRAGITEVFLPKENESNQEEIPKEVLDGLKITYVEKYTEVFDKLLK